MPWLAVSPEVVTAAVIGVAVGAGASATGAAAVGGEAVAAAVGTTTGAAVGVMAAGVAQCLGAHQVVLVRSCSHQAVASLKPAAASDVAVIKSWAQQICTNEVRHLLIASG